MMDPATARVALKLQLDDVDAILEALPRSDAGNQVDNERVAFNFLREDLLRKWNEVHGRVLAYNLLKEENAGRLAFTRLLSEEQQAERDHDMACRIAGMPVPQRPAAASRPTADANATDPKARVINGNALDWSEVPVEVNRIQIPGSASRFSMVKKRPVEEELVPTRNGNTGANCASTSNFKRARLDNVENEGGKPGAPQAVPGTPTKRNAHVDPAVLRETEDGRTKRIKHHDLDATITASSTSAVDDLEINKGSAHSYTASYGTCASCLDIHPRHGLLQLSCKDEGDTETHAYCRDCLTRLFECSVTDPSHFPPRCCSEVISFFSCIPFLPHGLVARFLARREELETPNRTYCSNTQCSKWIKPGSITSNVATCTACTHKTCATCKTKQHEGLCPDDEDVKGLMNVAQQKRWKTCPNCKEMVELAQGCYHITCRCRYEFCYLCLAKWHTCKCDAWDERNIVDRIPPVDNVAPPINNPILPPAVPAALLLRPWANGDFGPPVVQPAVQPQVQPHVHNHDQHQAPPVVDLNQQRRGTLRRKGNSQSHVHAFDRYYRSGGWDTTCNLCGNVNRWVNCCDGCDLKVCWYCTRHRV